MLIVPPASRRPACVNCAMTVPPVLTVVKIYTYPTLILALKLATAFLNF